MWASVTCFVLSSCFVLHLLRFTVFRFAVHAIILGSVVTLLISTRIGIYISLLIILRILPIWLRVPFCMQLFLRNIYIIFHVILCYNVIHWYHVSLYPQPKFCIIFQRYGLCLCWVSSDLPLGYVCGVPIMLTLCIYVVVLFIHSYIDTMLVHTLNHISVLYSSATDYVCVECIPIYRLDISAVFRLWFRRAYVVVLFTRHLWCLRSAYSSDWIQF